MTQLVEYRTASLGLRKKNGKPLIRLHTGEAWEPNPRSVCWWDSHGDMVDRLPMPLDYDETTKVWKVGRNEVFCSFNCCRAYNRHKQQGDWQFRDGLIARLARQAMHNKWCTESSILPAPSRALLSIYGGTMDYKAFRDVTMNKGTTLIELPRPMIAIPPAMHVQKIAYVPKPIPEERIRLAKERVAKRKADKLKTKGGILKAMGLQEE